jgi:DNA invertase Pin-like site-specific DNA recombinase|tara:strand:- start:758 stop:973 length:216 start_codon:yes stop_codon:yes gene_type:complete
MTEQTETMMKKAKDLTQGMAKQLEIRSDMASQRRELFRELFQSGVSQREIAKQCELDPQTVHNVIHDRRSR